MQLTVLGCRAGMPADGQPSSGYLVEAGSTVLLDCGPGITTALSAVADPEDLDAVLISHLHSDHCYDLLPLGKALLQARARRVGGDADPAHLEARRAAAAEVFDGPIGLAQPGTRHPVGAQRTERIR
jgi:ribonuclease BN (tRNA processing enzyme)